MQKIKIKNYDCTNEYKIVYERWYRGNYRVAIDFKVDDIGFLYLSYEGKKGKVLKLIDLFKNSIDFVNEIANNYHRLGTNKKLTSQVVKEINGTGKEYLSLTSSVSKSAVLAQKLYRYFFDKLN